MVKFLFCLIQIFVFTFSEEIEYKIIIDKLSKKSITTSIDFEHCIQKKSEKNFHYRGRPKKMSEIIKNEKLDKNPMNNNNIKYTKDKVVYIGKQSELDYIYYFPNSTIFLVNGNNNFSSIYREVFDPNYCFFEDFVFEFDNLKNYYIIINKEIGDVDSSLITVTLVLFFVFDLCFAFSFVTRTFCLKIYLPLYVFYFANMAMGFSFSILFSCTIFRVCYLSSIIYSMYKSYMLIHIIILLDGYSIIHHNYTCKQKLKITISIKPISIIEEYKLSNTLFIII